MPCSAFRAWLAFAAMGAIILMGACQRQPEANVSQDPAPDQPPVPVAERPLDRTALLQAVARAASAAALGDIDAEAQRELDGDRFELRIRFGCPAAAPTGEDGAFNVRFDAATRTLRLRAAPDLSLDDAWIAALAGDTVEAVEGFWLRRPWLLTAGCPTVASPAPAAGDSPPRQSNRAERPGPASVAAEEQPTAPIRSQRIGIAQFFTQTDARTGRRGERAYEATKVLGADEQPSSQGYDLVLSGRLARLPDGRVIPCRVHTVDLPPDCIVSVDIDRVRVERPDTRAVIAEWSA